MLKISMTVKAIIYSSQYGAYFLKLISAVDNVFLSVVLAK